MPAALKLIRLIVVLALAIVPGPFKATEATPRVVTNPVQDLCCDEAEACAQRAAPEANDEPADDDCCPGGCTHCFLSCCGGSVATLSGSVTPSEVHPTRSSVLNNRSEIPSVDPNRVYHPPRS